jgi:archaellum biogenesis protein FlaJ (TadC family)
MLLEAENKLLKVIRLRKITGIFTALSVAVFIFSLFVAPSMSPIAFYSLVAVAAFGIATYPAWFLLSKSNRKRRDQISSLFYKSNHEVETADGKMTLINRANYASVTQIHILDRKLGLFPNT